MHLNELNKQLIKEAEITSTTASLPDFMEDIERALKSSDKITVTITNASHEKLPRGNDHHTWGFAKGQLSWKIEKEEKDG